MYAEIIDNHHGRYIPQIWAEEVKNQDGMVDQMSYFVMLQGSGVADRHKALPLQYPLIGADVARCSITGRWSHVSDDDMGILLDGPDNEYYDDAFFNVLACAVFTEIGGATWHLAQGVGAPDLMLVHDGDSEFDAEYPD
jgi:hypothetical protein